MRPDEERELRNIISLNAQSLGALMGRLESMVGVAEENPIDGRWVAIGKTHLQQGLMALRRAVERPDTF